MVHIVQVEFVFDWLILLMSLIVFIVFVRYIYGFVPGEAKRIFMLLTVFLGIYSLSLLSIEGLEIAHFLTIHKAPLTEEMEETADLIAHILQAIGLGVLFYIAVLFRQFTKRLEKVRS